MTEPPYIATQDAVFELLGNPERCCRSGEAGNALPDARRIRVSRGQPAYKVKRAVRYPFLDFSSLDKRKTACEVELNINRTALSSHRANHAPK
jgi:uncharacterized protein